jgi:hypothetical protein
MQKTHTKESGKGYEFSLPFGSYVETCNSFYVFSGPKWPSSRRVLDPHPSALLFVCFPSSDATAPAPLASTHCRIAVRDAVRRNSPSVACTGPIFRRSEIVTFVTTASRRNGRRRCSIKMHRNDC